MARNSEFATVLDRIDSEIQQLQRMKDYLLGASITADAATQTQVAPKKRGRKPKAKSDAQPGTF